MTEQKTTASVTFGDLGVSEASCNALAERDITTAFPIQQATIEAALAGRDICGKAPTGSGKTLAFGVPTVELVAKLEPAEPYFPHALILAPTRELATQIKDEIESCARAHKRSVVTVFGGTSIKRDIRRLEKPVDILVACPGRLEDLMARRCVELRKTSIVVLDEADRMADMGFLPSVKRIIDQTAKDRTTFLFSATLDGDVDMLIHRYQNNPHMVEVETQAEERGDVEHSWYLIEPNDRIESAAAVLRSFYSSIVFCRTRRGCDRVSNMLKKRGLETVAIHGDRSQAQRERALKSFTSGKAQVMVATDVAARGIHVDNVALVMHYDPAATDKDHVHRSGRTGRAGQDGRVISMVVSNKAKIAKNLQRQLGEKVGFDKFEIDTLDDAGWVATPDTEREKDDRDFERDERGRGGRNRNDRGRGGRNRDDRGRGGRNRDDRGRGGHNRGRYNDTDNRDRSERSDRDRGDHEGRRDRYEHGRSRSNRNRRRFNNASHPRDNDGFERGSFRKRNHRDDFSRDERDDRGRGGSNRDDRGQDRTRRQRGNRRYDGDGRSNHRYDRDGRDDRFEGGREDSKRRFRPKRNARKKNDWYPRGYFDEQDDSRQGRSRRSSSGRNRRGEQHEYGGSNTKQRKPRSQKGRHADRVGKRNKGKRRG